MAGDSTLPPPPTPTMWAVDETDRQNNETGHFKPSAFGPKVFAHAHFLHTLTRVRVRTFLRTLLSPRVRSRRESETKRQRSRACAYRVQKRRTPHREGECDCCERNRVNVETLDRLNGTELGDLLAAADTRRAREYTVVCISLSLYRYTRTPSALYLRDVLLIYYYVGICVYNTIPRWEAVTRVVSSYRATAATVLALYTNICSNYVYTYVGMCAYGQNAIIIRPQRNSLKDRERERGWEVERYRDTKRQSEYKAS